MDGDNVVLLKRKTFGVAVGVGVTGRNLKIGLVDKRKTSLN